MPTIARTTASLIGIVAAFALVLYLAYGGFGGDSPATPTPTTSAVVAASPTARPQVTGPPRSPTPTPAPLGPEFIQPAGEVALPDDLALILQTGCWGCDGPANGLRRMYRDPSGELRVEQILTVDQLGIGPIYAGDDPTHSFTVGPYITGMAVSKDASRMLVALCIAEACGSGGLGAWSADARVAVFESTDGGVTWDSLGEYDGGLSPIAFLEDGSTLVSWYEQPVSSETQVWPTYALFPSMERVQPPSDGYYPLFTVGDDIVWQSYSEGSGRLVWTGGSTFADLGSRVSLFAGAAYAPGEIIPLVWDRHLSLVHSGGVVDETVPLDRTLYTALLLDEHTVLTSVGESLSDFGIDVENTYVGQVPGIIDLDTREMFVVSEHLRNGVRSTRDMLVAVQRGPFARVVNTGSCLNVREFASLDAPILTCAADNVLLRIGLLSEIDGEQWFSVHTPSGIDGWASAEYLEY